MCSPDVSTLGVCFLMHYILQKKIYEKNLKKIWTSRLFVCIFVETKQKHKAMTTISNQSGSKKVNITKNIDSFVASYVQLFQGMEQVLISKSFTSQKNAEKWANKILMNY